MKKLLSLLLVLCMAVGIFAGCGADQDPAANTDPSTVTVEEVDYAASVKLDETTGRAQIELDQSGIKQFVDGDTTHFWVPSTVMPGGILKARYLAVNTPESTGKIEEWGKKASNFTKEKLSSAVSIVVESDTATWDADSTGDRYLSWIWYKTEENGEYRNLNIELLQNGLAIASNSAQNSYGETAVKAIEQAKRLKLNVYSGEKDPDFYYGDAVELTLKELRTNTESYSGMKVAFEGVVTTNSNESVYVESFDPESGIYYGMAVYYGYGLNGMGMDILKVGNEVRIVGVLQFYEAGGTWQVSGLQYDPMTPKDPNNIQCISTGNQPAYMETDAARFLGKLTIKTDDAESEHEYAFLAMNTSLTMKNLRVIDIYTTSSENSSSNGAMTLTCQSSDGNVIHVRTMVLVDANGKTITESAYMGRTIDVRGIVDYYNGGYQIKVFSASNITVH